MEQYVNLRYEIDGVYGQIEYSKNILKDLLDTRLDKYIETFKQSESSPDVYFGLDIIDCATGDSLFSKWDVKGLPIYVGIDMGTYFRMAQLREMKNSNYINRPIDINFQDNIQDISDRVIKELTEKIKNINYKNGRRD